MFFIFRFNYFILEIYRKTQKERDQQIPLRWQERKQTAKGRMRQDGGLMQWLLSYSVYDLL